MMHLAAQLSSVHCRRLLNSMIQNLKWNHFNNTSPMTSSGSRPQTPPSAIAAVPVPLFCPSDVRVFIFVKRF